MAETCSDREVGQDNKLHLRQKYMYTTSIKDTLTWYKHHTWMDPASRHNYKSFMVIIYS
jgi:hypothetical protein